MKKFSIAIDGPAGAGKSTIAKILAKDLKLIYIDTGAMYRAIGYGVLTAGISLSDRDSIALYAQEHSVDIKRGDSGNLVYLDQKEITDFIRTPEVGTAASVVSAVPDVRKILVARQQEMGAVGGVVMDGRDIGTTVLPRAELKIYLVADVEERAKRRYLELQEKGTDISLLNVLEEVKNRDHADMTRESSPLRQAEDALVVDCTEKSISDVVDTIKDLLNKKINL